MSKPTDLQVAIDFERRRKAVEEAINPILKENEIGIRAEMVYAKEGVFPKVIVFDMKKPEVTPAAKIDQDVKETKPKKGKK
jgi:hypothetical protein